MSRKGYDEGYKKGQEDKLKEIVKIINSGIHIFEERKRMSGGSKEIANSIALLKIALFNIIKHTECINPKDIKQQEECAKLLWELNKEAK